MPRIEPKKPRAFFKIAGQLFCNIDETPDVRLPREQMALYLQQHAFYVSTKALYTFGIRLLAGVSTALTKNAALSRQNAARFFISAPLQYKPQQMSSRAKKKSQRSI